ncbi:MAG: hypothetical protein IPJ28_13335 [Betaproteobacteria bacterium]|nr:hypothetical protein [Betaproteobacteria bacterium]
MKFKALAAGLAILAGSAAVSAQTFALVPAQPQTFDPLVLRMTVDSCVYDQDRISVSASQGVFRVFIAVNPCLVPGPLKVIDVRLGALPAGPGRVEVFQIVGGDLLVRLEGGNIDFNVTGRPVIAVFPPPKKPNNDWSGNWVTQTELGWGLSIQQSPTDVLFAQLFVYAVNGAPVWFTFQEGQWKSATRWEGKLFASSGPGFTEPVFDPGQVAIQPLGTASIEFEQTPGNEAFATLNYVVGNVPVTKRIRKLLF